jgi:hypothetical protein
MSDQAIYLFKAARRPLYLKENLHLLAEERGAIVEVAWNRSWVSSRFFDQGSIERGQQVFFIFTGEVALVLAELWSDVDFREALFGTRDFVRERLLYYGRRGYLTARERQGILRACFAPAVTMDSRITTIVARRRGH